jgi:DNA modification methylase
MMIRRDLRRGCLFTGDNVEVMKSFPDNVIDLTVTSPPYDDMRTYTGESDWTFEKFQDIAQELFRITKTGGVIVWNVADKTKDGDESGSSFRQALWFKEIGFKLFDTMIWVKDGGGAIGSNKSYTQNHEYMFVFSKGQIKTSNMIRDKNNLSFGKNKSGIGRRKPTGEHKLEERKTSGEFSKRNNWWYIQPERGDHPAVFPLAMVRDHIVSWTNPGDTVFDPFMGSGTTACAAIETGRLWCGAEISEEYSKLAAKRIQNHDQH